MWLPCFVLSKSNLWMVWRCWYSVGSSLLFLFRINCKKGHLDKKDFCHCYGNLFQKWHSESYFDHSYVKSSFSIITRHIESSILKGILQLNISRTWINISAKSFINPLVNMTHKLVKVAGKRSVAQKSKRALRRTLHLNRLRFTYFIRLFFSQI